MKIKMDEFLIRQERLFYKINRSPDWTPIYFRFCKKFINNYC